MPATPLANVIRGNTVESVHSGHLSIIDGAGRAVAELGEPTTVAYYRSACKAFQMIPCITSGAADAFGFTDKEIAVSVASHSGDLVHIAIAARMLEKAGLDESHLRCGAHLPFSAEESKRLMRSGEEPTPLHNNCSGKHAAMLGFAKHIGADLETYELAVHRIQKRILRCISDFSEVPQDDIAIGIDGCAAPNFAIPVRSMAKSIINLISPARFPEPTQNACRRVVEAMIAHPELIGGSERLDTVLMLAARGRIISKVGADGVWLCGVLPCERWPTGLGIALKVSDGDDYRGRPVIAIEVLRQAGILAKNDLAELSPSPIKNRRGDNVGEVRTALSLPQL